MVIQLQFKIFSTILLKKKDTADKNVDIEFKLFVCIWEVL